MPWGSWSYPEEPQTQGGSQISPELIAVLRRHLGLDDATQSMTHQAEQPNPARPYLDAVASRLAPPDLTPAHLPGTEPKDYLRELYRNPDILNKGIDQAKNFIWTGTTKLGGKGVNTYGEGPYTYRPGSNENVPGGGQGTPQEDIDASLARLNAFFEPLNRRDKFQVVKPFGSFVPGQ